MRNIILFLFTSLIANCQISEKRIGGPFEDNDLLYVGMPEVMNETDTMAAWNTSPKKLIVYGIIYKADGKTPAPGTILYYYHTNEQGLYAPSPGQTKAKKHGGMRGWIKTNAKGEYKIYTIQPGAYPNRNIPAHIHMNIKEPHLNEYYIDDIQFDDDPLLTTSQRRMNTNRGGSGVIITGEKNGIMTAERNITLGLHIPDYPVKASSSPASGLSVGEMLPAFDPIHFSGPDKGKTRCPMCSYGSDQGILIWWNDSNVESLKKLLINLDPLIAQYGTKKFRVFAVYMNPDRKDKETVSGFLNDLVTKISVRNCALTFVPLPRDVETYKDFALDPKVRNTIMIYRKRKVIDKFVNIDLSSPQQLLTKMEL